jgi:hypothetical protein
MFALVRQVQALYRSYEDAHATGPNCIPTARNTKCYKDPLPGDDSLYGVCELTVNPRRHAALLRAEAHWILPTASY